MTLLDLLIFILLIGALFAVVQLVPMPAWLKTAAQIVLAVLVVIALIRLLGGYAGLDTRIGP